VVSSFQVFRLGFCILNLKKSQTALVGLNVIILASLKAIMEDEEEKLKQ
jgi:hypothetical protein